MGIFPSGVGLFPPFCAPFSPRTSGLRIAPVPARIYDQRCFLAGRLLPRRGGGAGLRRKQGRSSFLFLCFASSLSRFLCPPHPCAEGHTRPLLQDLLLHLSNRPGLVSSSCFKQKKSDFFWCLCLSTPFPTHHGPTELPAVHGILVSGSWLPSHLRRCSSHLVLESNPLFCTQMAFLGHFIWNTLVLDNFLI